MKKVEGRVPEFIDFKIFWKRCPHNLLARSCLVYGNGLVTALHCTPLHKSGPNISQHLASNHFLFMLREFKRLALGLLDQCFRTNEELTQQLLTYNLENWGGQTCLSLAVAIEHEEFLAHVSCQTLLTDIWTGAMKTAHRSSIKVRHRDVVLFAACSPVFFVGKIFFSPSGCARIFKDFSLFFPAVFTAEEF